MRVILDYNGKNREEFTYFTLQNDWMKYDLSMLYPRSRNPFFRNSAAARIRIPDDCPCSVFFNSIFFNFCLFKTAFLSHSKYLSPAIQAFKVNLCMLHFYLAKWLDEPGPLEAVPVGHVAGDGGEGHNHVLDTRQT